MTLFSSRLHLLLLSLSACAVVDSSDGKSPDIEETETETEADDDADIDDDADTNTNTNTDDDDDDDDNNDDDDDDDDDDDATDMNVDKRVVAYFAEWAVYDRDYHVWDIPVEHVTHINYAFADATTAGGCVVYDSWAALEKDGGNYLLLEELKATNPNLKTLISLGGWSLSGQFSDIALTETSRAAFVSDCVDFMELYGFDGIDVDWEYPVSGGLGSNTVRPEDKENYTLLLQAFRDELDARGDYLLTIAAPAGPTTIENFEVGELSDILDWANLMSYDLHGGWDSTTGFHAPLYAASDSSFPTESSLNVDAAVQTWLSEGMPADKLVLGVPFYGRGYASVDSEDGRFSDFSGLPPGTWAGEAGVFDYWDLQANYVGQGDWIRHWHPESMVPWLYSPSQQVMISYDDAESIQAKVDYVIEQDLGGMMFWELSGDTRTNELSGVIADGMRP